MSDTVRPTDMGFVGDLTLAFPGDVELAADRMGFPWQPSVRDSAGWCLWQSQASAGWKGYPLLSFTDSLRQVWLIGELYGMTGTGDQERFLMDLAAGTVPASKLNGHCLVMAWNRVAREWHIWTDRFGTVHAYCATDGTRTAVGTFLPAAASVIGGRKLDWLGLAGFFAFGFFPQDRTHFENVRILKPASHYVLSHSGQVLKEERYWNWLHAPDYRRSYDDTVAEFRSVFEQVLAEQYSNGRIAVPISGGLDSRTTLAAIPTGTDGSALRERIWSYSYGYTPDSVETRIASQVAAARRLPFQSFVIRPYLLDELHHVLASVEGFQDVTQCRQASVGQELAMQADYVIAAHWGDVWLDDMGLAKADHQGQGLEQLVSHAVGKIAKGGRLWLLQHLAQPQLGAEEPEMLLREAVRQEISRLESIEEPDFRIKAFKTDQWSFRWTLASIRMFQPGAFPRTPFYDTRLADFFGTVPAAYVANRRLQIDYLKRYAPDLARVEWQPFRTNLYRYQHFNTLLLPKRALQKVLSILTRRKVVERNWEVQFLSAGGRKGLEHWLLRPGLRLHDLCSPRSLRELLDQFYAQPLAEKRGYTVSMLLTFSGWLETYG